MRIPLLTAVAAAALLASAPAASAAILASDLPSGNGLAWSNKDSLQYFLVRFTLTEDSLINGFGIVNSNLSGGSETFPVTIRYAADVDGALGPITTFQDKLDKVTPYPAVGSHAVLSVANFDPILFTAGTYWMGMSAQGSAAWTWLGVVDGGPQAPSDQRQFIRGVLRPNPPTVYNLPFVVEGEAVAPVPEPAAWALMIAGFGLAGAALRARRRAAVQG
jgi:hypothetical protein